MSNVSHLLVQINRARRFAAAMTNDLERLRFEAMADDLKRELDLISDSSPESAKLN